MKGGELRVKKVHGVKSPCGSTYGPVQQRRGVSQSRRAARSVSSVAADTQPFRRESDWLICSEQPETSKSVERKRALPRFERKRSWPAVKARVSAQPWATLMTRKRRPSWFVPSSSRRGT